MAAEGTVGGRRVGVDDVGACALRRRTEPRARWLAGLLSSQYPMALSDKAIHPTFSAALVDSNISTLSWIECGDSKPEYRRRAQQCLEMARTFGDRDARVALSHMAEVWLRLAERNVRKQTQPAFQQQQQIQSKDDDKE